MIDQRFGNYRALSVLVDLVLLRLAAGRGGWAAAAVACLYFAEFEISANVLR